MRTILLLILFSSQVFAQGIKRHTIVAQGASITLNNKVFISQSVGQLSNIGLMAKPNLMVQQGYQRGNISTTSTLANYQAIQLTSYPNPFIDVVNLTFTKPINEPLTLMVTDLFGKVFFTKSFSNPELGISFKLDNVSPQTYVLILTGATINYSSKIVKAY